MCVIVCVCVCVRVTMKYCEGLMRLYTCRSVFNIQKLGGPGDEKCVWVYVHVKIAEVGRPRVKAMYVHVCMQH